MGSLHEVHFRAKDNRTLRVAAAVVEDGDIVAVGKRRGAAGVYMRWDIGKPSSIQRAIFPSSDQSHFPMEKWYTPYLLRLGDDQKPLRTFAPAG